MDWDGVIWVSAADRLCSLLGIEMTLTKGGSPTSYGQQGHVHPCYVLVRQVRTCVAWIPAPVGAGNKIAECWSAMWAARVSSTVMVGSQDTYLEAAELHKITRLHLAQLHTAGSEWLEQPARTRGGDENRGGGD